MSEEEEMLEYVENIAERMGYYLCPDEPMLEDLIKGLAENKERYGYRSCPCREASGVIEYDRDIICPCVSTVMMCRNTACYCGLYVSEEIKENPSKLGPIPERRPQELIDRAMEAVEDG